MREEFASLDGDATRGEAIGERGEIDGKRGSTGLSEEERRGGGGVACWPISGSSNRLRARRGGPTAGRTSCSILVDEMRFPRVFPAGVQTPAEFLRRYMPNVFYLWQHGVKFESYYSSGNACSPARATIATGLYPHQQWLLATRTTSGPCAAAGLPHLREAAAPVRLPHAVLRQVAPLESTGQRSTVGYLENYGFRGMTNPDPVGTNGQGAEDDVSVIADSAASGFGRRRARVDPVLHHRQLREPARQAVLLGGVGGNVLRNAVQEPGAEAVQPELHVGCERGRTRRRWDFRASRRTGSHMRTSGGR